MKEKNNETFNSNNHNNKNNLSLYLSKLHTVTTKLIQYNYKM